MHKTLQYYWVVFWFSIEQNIGRLAIWMFLLFSLLAIFGNVSMRQCLVAGLGIEGIRTFMFRFRHPGPWRTIDSISVLPVGGFLVVAYLLVWWALTGWNLFPIISWLPRTIWLLLGFATAYTIHIGYLSNRRRFAWIDEFFTLSSEG